GIARGIAIIVIDIEEDDDGIDPALRRRDLPHVDAARGPIAKGFAYVDAVAQGSGQLLGAGEPLEIHVPGAPPHGAVESLDAFVLGGMRAHPARIPGVA